jgi:hypothetical protein
MLLIRHSCYSCSLETVSSQCPHCMRGTQWYSSSVASNTECSRTNKSTHYYLYWHLTMWGRDSETLRYHDLKIMHKFMWPSPTLLIGEKVQFCTLLNVAIRQYRNSRYLNSFTPSLHLQETAQSRKKSSNLRLAAASFSESTDTKSYNLPNFLCDYSYILRNSWAFCDTSWSRSWYLRQDNPQFETPYSKEHCQININLTYKDILMVVSIIVHKLY